MPIVLGTLDRPSLDAAGITQTHELAFNNLKGRGVLVGIVDTGVDYTKDIFRYEDGANQSVSGVPPEGFYYGTEYTNVQINEAFNAENPYDIVPQQDTSGHGTFLASITAGREIGDFERAAPDAEYFSYVSKIKGVCICIAAGNESQARHHMQ